MEEEQLRDACESIESLSDDVRLQKSYNLTGSPASSYSCSCRFSVLSSSDGSHDE